MKRVLSAVLICLGILPLAAQQAAAPLPAPLGLPTSKLLYTVPGAPQRTNSLPTALVVSPDGRYVAVLNAGYGTSESGNAQSIAILELSTGKLTDFPDAHLKPNLHQDYSYGLAFNARGDELFASIISTSDPEGRKEGNIGNGIAVYSFTDGRVTPKRFLKIPLQTLAAGKKYPANASKVTGGKAVPSPAGLAVVASPQGARLLVANNLADNAILMDATTGETLATFDLSISDYVPASYPYAVVATRDGRRAWVSLWNTSQVAELDLEHGKVVRTLQCSSTEAQNCVISSAGRPSGHASALALTPDEKWLYVAFANCDTVQAFNTATGYFAYAFHAELPGQKAFGAFPDALAIDAAANRLYVANASTDSVAVFRIGDNGAPYKGRTFYSMTAQALGFIPTEWYPTAIAISQGKLVIASGKGRGTGPNKAKSEPGSRKPFRFVGNLLYGSLATIETASIAPQLASWTAEVLRSNLISGNRRKLDFTPSDHSSSPIHHVIYIIKENRTYDQLFGDIAAANGDPSLVMYGEEITPNQHALARQFGVLDNFYDSGEVSGDGHVWSTAAITSDYMEKTWQTNYRNNERTYDYEGEVAGEMPLLQGIANVDSPASGYLWTNVARAGIRYRHYGEFVDTTWCGTPPRQNSPASTGLSSATCTRKSVAKGEPLPAGMGAAPGTLSPWPWPVPIIAANTASMPELVGHFDPAYADFRQDYPDQYRVDEFLREFSGFVNARQKHDEANELPNLVVLRLPNDHTSGARPFMPSPRASVADNDLALGRLVEAVSRSPYWDDTAILVLEDDAQDGPDHVDAHRSIALVISKYSPRGSGGAPYVEHRFYTTVNMIRTLEDLLGLPPMNQNDAHAAAMEGLFSGRGDQPPFIADYRNRDNGMLYEANPEKGPGARASMKMDFSREDRAPAALLNRVLWQLSKGNMPMPRPKHNMIPENVGRD